MILENPLIGLKNSRTIKIPWFSSIKNINVSKCDKLTLLFNIFLNKLMFWVFLFSFGFHFSIPYSHSMTPTICDSLLLKYMQILKWWSNRIYSINFFTKSSKLGYLTFKIKPFLYQTKNNILTFPTNQTNIVNFPAILRWTHTTV